MNTTLVTRAAGLMMACLLAAVPVAAQDVAIPKIATDGSLSIEQIESVIQSIAAREGIDDEVRGRIVEQLRDARTQIGNRLAAETTAAAHTDSLMTAPAETASLRAGLDAETSVPPTLEGLGITDATTLDELTLMLSQELAEQIAIESRIIELDAQIEAQGSRPADARRRIGDLRTSRDELAAAMSASPPLDEQQALTDARMLNTELRRIAHGAEINMLEQELVSHSVRLELLRARLDVAQSSRLQRQRRVEFLRTQVNERRQTAASLAQQTAEVIELAAADAHPVVRALAEDNAGMTRELPSVVARIELATTQLDQINADARELEQRLARSRQRLGVGGLSRSIGLLLIEESRNLPQVSQHRVQVNARSNLLAEVGLAQMRIQEQRRELRSLDARVEIVMTDVVGDVTDEDELARIRSEVHLLLRDRRDLLAQAEDTYSSYLQVLGDLDVAQRRLLESAGEYREFLGQNLLWIPSAPVVFTGNWKLTGPVFLTALSPNSWLETASDLTESISEHPAEAVFALLLLTTLLLSRKPLAHRNKAINDRIGRLSSDHIGLTLAALGIAALLAAPLSLLLAITGWFLSNAAQLYPFSTVVTTSLFAVAPFLYNVMLFRALSAENGVLHKHFGWQQKNVVIVRRQFDRLAAIGAPLVFATVLFYASDVAEDRATMGRLIFVALMIALSAIIRPLAHPVTGVAANYYNEQSSRWVSKLRWFWYGLAVGAPALLAILSLIGYLYTSLILTSLLVDTIWLALALILVNLIVLRWIALTHRKLALKILLQEREAARALRDKEGEAEPEGELPDAESKPLDLEEVDAQTRKLLRWGLILVAALAGWGIWSEVFPAFQLLEQVALWSQTVLIDGVETIVPVTLADLILAVLVAAGAAIASKNLPGLMEIAILQRLTLQPGSRYAINTLTRYIVVTIGLISVLNIIGWNWSQIQWLVAALSVGLGFGLQEIVANFVSGLIILFERPIRVGDTVTVGALSGKVSRVRIRATTITDWDRKEIIVPNKAFITEQVVNWTLADPITRVVVPVGISYGSDVELAQKVMEDTLHALPLVLDEPEPRVFFIGFGDSSLDFSLRVHARQLADRLPLMHAVHNAILKALREHGIEIPFPQRDLHIQSNAEQQP
ncbi:MAG: mechanosensitive ion channel [Gammaproteobacteria bacterium]|nr:mechanosensitive ion channel [Gammaproteobacteria bacterium]